MTGLGNPPTCGVQFVNEDFLGETICCVITGLFTEEEEKAEEEEEEARENLSIGNPFSFVIRSQQTLQGII
jgi:hypothetical protein